MKKKLVIGLIVAVVLVMILGGTYNGFVNVEENVTNKWAQVENNMQRRADLIPNLVNVVKGYASHEKEIFENIANARAKLAGATGEEEKMAADQEMNSSISRLLMIVENYPNLKADTQYTKLMDELAGTENRLATSRKDYNDVVTTYNKKIRSFPGSTLAGMFGFDKKSVFEADDSSKEVPKVEFGGK